MIPNFESFKVNLANALGSCSVNYDFNPHWTNTHACAFYITCTLDQHATKKKEWIRGNHKPQMNSTLGKAIMLRSKLKDWHNKSKDTRYIKMYKQQRNLVARLNKDSKYSYFSNLDITKETKPFWKVSKLILRTNISEATQVLCWLKEKN